MEDQEQQQSVDPSTQVSSPDNPTPAAAEPNMSVGQGSVDPAVDAKQKKIEDFCGMMTDPKIDPQNSTVGRGLSWAQDKAIGKLPAALQAIAPNIKDGPTGYGFGQDAKDKCIERENASAGEKIKMDLAQIKQKYDDAKKN
jgi:hypothetical protein